MRYIIGFLIGLGLIVLLFVLIFRGGSSPQKTTQTPLVDYANTSVVMEFIDDSPVSADQTHHQIVTTVGRDQTVFTIEQGYQGQVQSTQTYANNATSYANFLAALQNSGYTIGDTSPSKRDERGVCPLGRRFIFEIKDGDNIKQRLWSTSCGDIGSFHGKTTTVRDLYRLQVPDYGRLTSQAGLLL